jgi:hypothetical protein
VKVSTGEKIWRAEPILHSVFGYNLSYSKIMSEPTLTVQSVLSLEEPQLRSKQKILLLPGIEPGPTDSKSAIISTRL